MREKEIEFKNLLTEDEYQRLFTAFNLGEINTIINKNYYYDDNEKTLKKFGAALRLRFSGRKNEITLKTRKLKGNIEINVPIDNKLYPNAPQVLSSLPEVIMAELKAMNVNIKTPLLFQKITTIRKELRLSQGLLVLDKTIFLNDVVDYELEFEVSDYNDGKLAFEKILREFNIIKRSTKPKIARAEEYAKNKL
ncbi:MULTISPECIES: CYTH domain-containing protein [Gemella]|uniref:CYTH domain-containing protein n=1 Tax=Gemella TaxID=1378 RepID=UPI0007684B44|nr:MULTISPECIES: CYTH domain-containing protein [Gemella]AME08864.1 adenylate cyclase [Gemella sp. oral taxon 928]AXI26435.1 CYTH domain-containing protein [Gemella sp. ND 6198]